MPLREANGFDLWLAFGRGRGIEREREGWWFAVAINSVNQFRRCRSNSGIEKEKRAS